MSRKRFLTVAIALACILTVLAISCASPAPAPTTPAPAPKPTTAAPAPTTPAPTTAAPAPTTPKPTTPAPTTPSPAPTTPKPTTATKIVLNLADKDPPTHAKNVSILIPFAEEVNKLSGGRVEIKLHMTQSLFKATELLDAIQTGAVEMVWMPTSYFTGTIPIWALPFNPFLFNDYDHLVKGWQGGISQDWDGTVAKLNSRIVGGTFYYNGLVHLWSNKSIPKLPADVKGLKIRSFNPIIDTLLATAGAAPVSMASPDIYLSMQRGTIDGHVTNVVAIDAYKLQEVTKYGALLPITPGSVDFMMVTQKAWQAIPPDLQKLIDDTAAKYLTAWGKTNEPATVKTVLDKVTKAGMQIYTPTAQDIEAWRKISQPAYDKFIQTAGDMGKKEIDIMTKLK